MYLCLALLAHKGKTKKQHSDVIKRMRQLFTTVIISVLCSIITLLCYLGLTKSQASEHNHFARLVSHEQVNLNGDIRGLFKSSYPSNFISAAQSSIPSVVAIVADRQQSQRSSKSSGQSSGSGVFISSQGHIATNYHVIENVENIKVIDTKGYEYKASILGTDKSTDIAILKIEASQTPFFTFGNSDSLQVGEWVLAVGNPFKLQSSVTAGIVSAKGRDINLLSRQGVESFIQTDAAINPGNSGGALVNTNGELIGINTAILSYSGKYEGFSFAIPSNIIQKVSRDIMEYGAVQRGWLGINIFNVHGKIASELGYDSVEGVLVDLVERNSAAAEAGIRKNDIITAVNGADIDNIAVFTEQLSLFRPGDKVTITYWRTGRRVSTEVTLRNQLNTTDFIAVRKDAELTDLGFEVRDMDDNEVLRLGKQGVYVVSIYRGSKIYRTNMDPGFIIETFNGKTVKSVDDLLSEIKSSRGQVVLEGFYEQYPGSYPYTFML